MAEQRYQLHRTRWTAGVATFAELWPRASDWLRFHGKYFRIIELGKQGPRRVLNGPNSIHHYLPARIDDAPLDRVFIVKAESDGYELKFRRHMVTVTRGNLIIQHCRDLVGTQYVYGATDCSWLVMTAYGREGIVLPHNSEAIFNDPQVVQITRAQIRPGDMLDVHAPDHIAIYRGHADLWLGDTVWDTEPHDAPRPQGGMQGVGVRVRSMNPGYYCDWRAVSKIGRVVAINGKP
jgi:cell wall-associated NlpC family hydrolase